MSPMLPVTDESSAGFFPDYPRREYTHSVLRRRSRCVFFGPGAVGAWPELLISTVATGLTLIGEAPLVGRHDEVNLHRIATRRG